MPRLKEAIIMIKNSWRKVTKETIVNCWKKLAIIDYTESIEVGVYDSTTKICGLNTTKVDKIVCDKKT